MPLMMFSLWCICSDDCRSISWLYYANCLGCSPCLLHWLQNCCPHLWYGTEGRSPNLQSIAPKRSFCPTKYTCSLMPWFRCSKRMETQPKWQRKRMTESMVIFCSKIELTEVASAMKFFLKYVHVAEMNLIRFINLFSKNLTRRLAPVHVVSEMMWQCCMWRRESIAYMAGSKCKRWTMSCLLLRGRGIKFPSRNYHVQSNYSNNWMLVENVPIVFCRNYFYNKGESYAIPGGFSFLFDGRKMDFRRQSGGVTLCREQRSEGGIPAEDRMYYREHRA